MQQENLQAYQDLNEKMLNFAMENANEPYPFGSELYTDQTAHSQVFTFMKKYDFKEKMLITLQATKALRAGGQPIWFRYGNEQRGNVCCWYGTALNSYVMLSGFEQLGDMEMLKWGIAGLTSFMTTVRPTGVAQGWFTWWPDRTGFDLRSLDTDMGLYGYLKAAKSYVVREELFGLVGYCCKVQQLEDGEMEIIPWDGLNKRLVVIPFGLELIVEKGELSKLTISSDGKHIFINLMDSTDLVKNLELKIAGVKADSYTVKTSNFEKMFLMKNNEIKIDNIKFEEKQIEIEVIFH